MKSEWKVLTVNELIKLGYIEEPLDGNHGSIHPKASDYVSSGVPFIMANNIINGRVDYNNCAFITQEQASKLRKGFSKPRDVLLTHKATIGRTAIVSDEFDTIVLTPQVTYYRVIKGLNNRYLKYYFDSYQFQQLLLNWAGAGSTRAYLGISAQKKLPIVVPPIEIQNKISSILSALDDKIELNQKINENLEQQAQAIFKSWFVDFEPFKDSEFVNSELGQIPKGWKVDNLLNIADYTNGLAMQKFRPKENEAGIPVLKIRELRQGFCDSSSDICSENIKSDFIINDGDIIFSWSGSLMIDFWCGGKCGLNQHLFKVTSNEYDKWFYYMWTEYHLEKFIAIAKDKATTMGHIKREELKKSLVLIPDEKSYNKILQLMKPIYDTIIKKRLENKTLAKLRDALLPKLMNGEIDVNMIK